MEDARNQRPEVVAVAGSLRDLRERNHFADLLYEVMGGSRSR